MCKEIYHKIKQSKWNQGHLLANPNLDRFFNGIFWVVMLGGLLAIIGIIIWLCL